MDPVTTALVAGATFVFKGLASEIVKEAYKGLTSLLTGRLASLAILEKDPVNEHFVKAAEASPSNAFPHFHMAMEYERRKETEKAIKALREALRVNPEMIAAYNDLAWLLATSATPIKANQLRRRQNSHFLRMGFL